MHNTLKGAMQWDFDDLILVSPIIQNFGRQTFLLLFSMPEYYIKTTVKENFWK